MKPKIEFYKAESIEDLNPDFILETEGLLLSLQTCKESLDHSRMCCIIADNGIGKTKSVDTFCRKYSDKVYHMTVDRTMSEKQIFIHLMNKLGIKESFNGSTIHDLVRAVSYHLNNMKSSKLLVFDEAGKFTENKLLLFHELRDKTKENTGIIFSGPPYFRRRLESWNSQGKEGIPELYSRIQDWITIEKPSISEKVNFCYQHGIINKNYALYLAKKYYDFRQIENRIQNDKIELLRNKGKKKSSNF